MTSPVESQGSVDKLRKRLLELQKECLLCDVMLSTDDGVVSAHSLVLAAASPLLCDLFVRLVGQTPATRTQYSVDLSGFSSSDVRMALCFLYNGEIHDTNEVVGSQLKIRKICNILGVDRSMFITSDAEETE